MLVMYDIPKDYMEKRISEELVRRNPESVVDYEQGYVAALNWMLSVLNEL